MQVLGQRRVPCHSLAGRRVIESQVRGMKSEPGRAAIVWNRLAMDGSIVDALAANRSSSFTQVNADLMCPARFEPALYERVTPDSLHHLDMCHRSFSQTWCNRAAAAAISAVVNQHGFNSFRPRLAPDNSKIASVDCVSAKLLSQVPLCLHVSRKDDQAAGVFIEAVDCAHRIGFRFAASQ